MLKEDEKVPFTAHLEELRERLIVCFIAVSIAFLISFGFAKYLFDYLAQPLMAVMRENDRLVFDSLTEPIFTYLKVALLAAFILASPVILYQFWLFVAPGLYKKEKQLMLPVVIFSTIFFVIGVIFAYKIVFPLGFHILLRYDTDSFQGLLSINKYMALSTKLLLGFGIVFELPLVLTLMARFGIVSVEFLKQKRKYALILFFIFGALLTPPDVISQIAMAGPLMVLYEISIISAKIFGRKKTGEESQDHKEEHKEDHKTAENTNDQPKTDVNMPPEDKKETEKD